jgi:nifR3 family TIM-barrel protein
MSTTIPPRPTPRPPLALGSQRLGCRYTLAPLAGYTNLPFRLVVREVGAPGLCTTDLVNARALLIRSRKTMDLVQTSPEDRPLSIQLYGSNPAEMVEAARWCQDYGVQSVDVNMGCPVHKITKGGGGSAMMCDTAGGTIDLIRAIVESVSIPVTVKMRLGWDATTHTAPHFAREFEKIGVAGITIHGRTREQGFKGSVDLEGISRVVEAVERIPILGNGDVRNLADAERMLRVTGCAGIAIGRGALLNPWFFRQLASWETTGDPGAPATYRERLDLMVRHFHLLVKYRGEIPACLNFRKVVNWYCKVLKPGHTIQQALVQIDSVEHFDRLAAEIAEIIAQRGENDWPEADLPIRVPSGPIEHW